MNSAYSTLLEKSREAFEQIPRHHPAFQFKVGLANGYDELLSADYVEITEDFDQLLDMIRLRGRMVLSGHAGTGKTSISLRLMTHALLRGWPTLRIDLRRWTPSLDERWRGSLDIGAQRIGLLSPLATPTADDQLVREALGEGAALVVVDGLNEVPAATARAMPAALDLLAQRNPGVGIVLCDRFQRRDLPSEDWLLGTIAEVRGASPSPHLDSALLLDISKGTVDTQQTEADLLVNFLCANGKIKSPEEGGLSEAALRLYEDESRYFKWSALLQLADPAMVARLVASGVICRDRDWAFFHHHLFHDALAAHAVARRPESWVGEVFDILTFNANSFDAVGLGLEQIRDEPAADRFLLAVYDWNLYAAAYALARGRRLGSLAVSTSTEEAMLAVLAERRWDPIAPSAQRVADALRVFETPLARRYLEARDTDEVFSIVAEGANREGGEDWRQLFLGEVGTNRLLDELVDGGPLNGWIAANALRRESLAAEHIARIAIAARDESGTARWRAVHVLGTQNDRGVERLLFDALDGDVWVWVRYGAIRALVELAAHSEDLQGEILVGLTERVPDLAEQPRVMAELEKALQLRNPPDGWASAVAPLLEQVFSIAATVSDQDHWRTVGRRIEESVRMARSTGS